MAIHETKRQSDLEKRLQLLRRQVYGRRDIPSVSSNYQLPTTVSKNAIAEDGRLKTVSNISYLRQDLLKILTLSGLAIGTQLILFFLLKNHILNLNFF